MPPMTTTRHLSVSVAKNAEDLRLAQRLRYDVFVKELGGTGPDVDHINEQERDKFDDVATHLLLRDHDRPEHDQVVGVYRVLTSAGADQVGQFYCESEYNLKLLKASGERLLELGRSSLHRDYRGGAGL